MKGHINMTKQMLSAAVSGVILMGAIAHAGNGAGSSGGGDNINDDSGAAWFLGSDRLIRACFELGSGFGVSGDSAKREIEGAFAAWRDYIDRKLPRGGLTHGNRFPSLATQVVVSNRCVGNEDLVFYFGITNEEIRLAKAKYDNPTAFAFRRSYDPKKRWGQGWVWFAPPASVFPKEGFPDWSPQGSGIVTPETGPQPWVLRTMLMHEVGHVLGNSHVPGTIMSERISEYMRAARSPFMAQIDQERELAVCWECPYEWNGSLSIPALAVIPPGGNAGAIVQRIEHDNFELLVGHRPKAEWLSARIEAQSIDRGTVLTIGDQFETFRFPIEFSLEPLSSNDYSWVEDSTETFKRIWQMFYGKVPRSASERVKGVVAYGTLTTSRGERLTLIMERNLPVPEPSVPSRPAYVIRAEADYRLKVIHDGRVRPLFEASWLKIERKPFEGHYPIPAPSPSR
jgi:hypothetical protein